MFLALLLRVTFISKYSRAGLEIPLASVSCVLGLQVCASMPGWPVFMFFFSFPSHLFVCIFISFVVCVCLYMCTYNRAGVWKSEDDLQKLALSYPADTGD